MQPLIRPRGNNNTDKTITPPNLLPPFLQLLRRSETRLLSIVLVVAWVRHILPALPHEPFGSAENSMKAGVPALINTLVPSAEYTSVSTIELIVPVSALLSALKFSLTRRTIWVPFSNTLLLLLEVCAKASNGVQNMSATISTHETMPFHSVISFFICL